MFKGGYLNVDLPAAPFNRYLPIHTCPLRLPHSSTMSFMCVFLSTRLLVKCFSSVGFRMVFCTMRGGLRSCCTKTFFSSATFRLGGLFRWWSLGGRRETIFCSPDRFESTFKIFFSHFPGCLLFGMLNFKRGGCNFTDTFVFS